VNVFGADKGDEDDQHQVLAQKEATKQLTGPTPDASFSAQVFLGE
jgi:hypothetical protein